MAEYIEREVLLKKLHEAGGCGAEPNTWADGYDKAIDHAYGIAQKIPAADVAPVRRGRGFEVTAGEKRLIDATDAEKWAHEHILDAKEKYAILDFLRNCSTVDAAEVVRCRDCRFYEAGVEYYGGGTKDICRLFKRQMQPDAFCSVGERRDGKEG